MKITVYTIKDCAFSKQEKEYLNANKLSFEEKDLEINKDFLTEMLAISNNFAGTPVTRVEKDDGSIAVLKGFTKEEFDTTFGVAPTTTPTTPPLAEPTPVSNAPIETSPVVETPPVENIAPASTPTPTETPVTNTPDPLQSVMDNLQAKTAEPMPIDSSAPTIPDFPADTKTTTT
jgi:glutaredoxin